MLAVLFLALGLSAFATSDVPCAARYDELGVPHQKVESVDQYYYCFGYHHGRDRAWEMDYFRRVGKGLNAEIYGVSSIKSDIMMRLLDLPRLAKRLLGELPEAQKTMLRHYSAGVNKGFEIGRAAKEFVDKGYGPTAWEPEDSILVLLLQSFDQTRKTFVRDYDEEKWREKWGDQAEALFDEDGVPWLNTIVKEGEYPKREDVKKVSSAAPAPLKLWANFPTVFGEESGSNNWVIAKAKSKTGAAMLANDPHLDLKTPLFWYWIHLEGPTEKVIGASVPGAPIVVSGTNGSVAWGLTNAYINTADALFVPEAKDEDFESVRPTVMFKFGFLKLPFFFKSFERTKAGYPVLPLELEKEGRMVLRWSGFYLKGEDLAPMFGLVYAKTVDDLNETLKGVGLPAWNFVFADTKGDIAYRVVGKPFKHADKPAFGVATVPLKELEAPEFLGPMERPHVYKPKRNYIYTANNRHWPADARYHGGRAYSYSFRGFRIDELLRDGKFDWQDLAKVQCDRQAVDARFFVPLITKYVKVSEFDGWNFDTDANSLAVATYRRLMDLMMEKWTVNEHALYRVLQNLEAPKVKELEDLVKHARGEVNGRKWGDFHRLTFAHLSKNSEWSFSPELPGLGDNHSVDPGTAKWDEERSLYEHYSGASMRMIVELTAKPVIHLALPGYNRDYQSGQAFSPWEPWAKCEYREVKIEL